MVRKVNEVALEVSAANKVNKEYEVNVKEESSVNEESGMVCNIEEVAPEVSYAMIKEMELHIAHNVQEEQSGAEVQVEQNGAKVQVEQNGAKVQVEQNGDKFDEVKSDVNVEAKVEVFGMKELKDLEDDEEVEMRLPLMMKVTEQSRCANWDPGELLDAKDQMEMLNVKEVTILVNIIDKVGPRLFMKEVWLSGGATEKALLIVMFLLRFENGFRRKCPIELSDYG